MVLLSFAIAYDPAMNVADWTTVPGGTVG